MIGMTKIQVLHIDDNLHDRMLVKDVLTKEHSEYELYEADNQESFIQMLEQKKFDIVLSDFNILGFDGLQVLDYIDQKQPELPVIIVTGTGSEEVAIQAMKKGASDYVIKSIRHIKGLAHSIDMVLANKRNEKAHKEAIAALQESEEKYRRIFENTQDIFYQTNHEGIITEISPSVFRASGFTREDLIGLPASEIYHDPVDREILVRKITSEGEVWDYVIRMKTKTGETKFASLNAHIYYDKQHRPIGIEGSLRDITDRKLMEEELIAAKEKAEESDHLKTAFLHNISHEIRTPMNSIVGFSELINDPEVSPESRQEYTDIIVKSSNHLLSIITDIIAIATIEAKQEKLSEKKVDLNSVTKLIFNQFSPQAEKLNLRLEFENTLSESKFYIICDETKLIQIISNLVGNALKFTKSGYIRFDYFLVENPDGEKMLKFTVEDTGIGIPQNRQEDIFQRFRQVEGATKRQFGGSGLGLSISKAYVELMGGTIGVESEVGKGSTFKFTIPYKPAQYTKTLFYMITDSVIP